MAGEAKTLLEHSIPPVDQRLPRTKPLHDAGVLPVHYGISQFPCQIAIVYLH